MTLKGEEKLCPLCGQDNNCKHGQSDCWCNIVEAPKYIIDMVPDDKKGMACICKSCLEKYKRSKV